MSFTYNIKQKSPVTLVALYGDLIDRDECRELTQYLQVLCDDGEAKIVLDLSDVKVMNSTGLNILIQTLTHSRKSGGDTVLCGIPDRIRKLFIITKLNTIFQVFDTDTEALEHFNKA